MGITWRAKVPRRTLRTTFSRRWLCKGCYYIIAASSQCTNQRRPSNVRSPFIHTTISVFFLSLGFDIANPFNPNQDRHKQEKEEVSTVTESFKSQLLVPEKVTRCVEVLVTKFFVLRHSDLQSWEEEPENWTVTWDDQS